MRALSLCVVSSVVLGWKKYGGPTQIKYVHFQLQLYFFFSLVIDDDAGGNSDPAFQNVTIICLKLQKNIKHFVFSLVYARSVMASIEYTASMPSIVCFFLSYILSFFFSNFSVYKFKAIFTYKIFSNHHNYFLFFIYIFFSTRVFLLTIPHYFNYVVATAQDAGSLGNRMFRYFFFTIFLLCTLTHTSCDELKLPAHALDSSSILPAYCTWLLHLYFLRIAYDYSSITFRYIHFFTYFYRDKAMFTIIII